MLTENLNFVRMDDIKLIERPIDIPDYGLISGKKKKSI